MEYYWLFFGLTVELPLFGKLLADHVCQNLKDSTSLLVRKREFIEIPFSGVASSITAANSLDGRHPFRSE